MPFKQKKLVFDEINASNLLQKPHLAAIPEWTGKNVKGEVAN